MTVLAEDDVPAVMMDHPMVVTAQQHQVMEVGWSAVGPVHPMMGYAPTRRPGTARKGASAVSCGQRRPLASRHEPLFPANIERYPCRVGEDPADPGMTADPACCGSRDRPARGQLAGCYT